MKIIALVVAGLALCLPSVTMAQADQCSVPARIERPRLDRASADQPRRLLPIGGYTLALTWSPNYCAGRNKAADSRFQCGSGNRFGFTLHGLWPDGQGRDWPQYCKPARLLAESVLRENLCATPSVQLLQHEWAKHGTCMDRTPDAYFDQARTLYGRIRYPAMGRLAARPLTAGAFATAFVRANRGWTSDMIRVRTARGGWLDELWLCLDTRFRPARCPGHQRGARDGTRLRIRT